MMYERPPTTPFQNPPRNTTFPFQRYTLVFQQHQDEPIYDAWTHFKNLIKRVPHHGLDLWSLTQFFYDHVDDYTRMDLDFAADGNLRELSGEEAWEAIENFAQGQKEWDNPPNIISEQEVANLKAQAKRLFGNEDVWVEMHREVEPLDKTQLEDLGLNTYNHDIPLSNREVPSFDESEPQPNPLPNCLSLDVSLGEERGPEPPIKPHSPVSFRMKEVDSLTINTPPSPHVASSHPKDTYCYYRPCIDDPKKHYGFKPGLLGKSVSLGVDISNWEMFDDDWGFESKEVSPLGEELSLFDRPNEVERGRILEAHRLESILQQQISQRMAPSHHDGNMSRQRRKIPDVVASPNLLGVSIEAGLLFRRRHTVSLTQSLDGLTVARNYDAVSRH
ncbi:hypothetical protein Tco_1074075, partial [Tanacetum coccineum]